VSPLDRLRSSGLLALLVFAPLPYGSVVPWAHAVIEATAALLAGAWVWGMLRQGALRLRPTPLLWPALAMAAVVGLQLLWQLLRPGALASPHATGESARLFLAYLALLLLLGDELVTRRRIVRALAVVIGAGAVLALLGRQNQTRGGSGILWLARDPDAHLDRLTSTFVNPNHQAFYLNVLFFLAVGLLLALTGRRRAPDRDGGEARGTGRALERLPAAVAAGAAVVVLGGALLLTASRGGLLAAAAGVVVVAGVALAGRRPWTAAAVGGLLLLGVLAYASLVGLEPLAARLLPGVNEPIAGVRGPLWTATLRLAGDAGWLGVGLGGFEDAFGRHRPAAVPARYLVDYAHNDYLQLLAETGVVGLGILAWAAGALLVFVLRRWRHRQDPFVRGLTVGALGALAAAAVHSAVDFGVHLPGNALAVLLVAALLPPLVTLRPDPAGDRVGLREWRLPVGPRARLLGLVACPLAVGVVWAVVLPAGLADWHRRTAEPVVRALDRTPRSVSVAALDQAERTLARAAWLDPRSPAVQATHARVAAELAVEVWNRGVGRDGRPLPAGATGSIAERAAASEALFATAHQAYAEALRRRPRGADLHERYGWFLGGLETVRRALRTAAPDGPVPPRLRPLLDALGSLAVRGLGHVRQAVALDPQSAYRQRSLALYALAHLRHEPEGRQTAGEAIHRALVLEPGLAPDLVDRVAAADPELLLAAVPRQYGLFLDVARELVRRGQLPVGRAMLAETLRLASGPEQEVPVRLLWSHALLRSQDPAGALAEARRALVLAPRKPEVHGALAEAYEASAQWDEAQRALATAVALAEPGAPARANEYRARLAALLARRGEGEQALGLRRRTVQAAPRDPWAHVELGRVHEGRGEWAEAFREYRVAEALEPRDARLHREVAQAYLRNGLLREAALAYETALRLSPVDLELRVALAQLYTRMGRREQALEHYRAIAARQTAVGAAGPPAALTLEPLGGPTR
jgi:tetratricopeptide (TPR) repeat protein/O-antigen ligase